MPARPPRRLTIRNFRVRETEDQKLEAAALAVGETVSTFVRSAALERATVVLQVARNTEARS